MTKNVSTDHVDGSTVTFVVVRRECADVRAAFVFGQRTDQSHRGEAENIGCGNQPRFDVSYTYMDADDSCDYCTFDDITRIIWFCQRSVHRTAIMMIIM